MSSLGVWNNKKMCGYDIIIAKQHSNSTNFILKVVYIASNQQLLKKKIQYNSCISQINEENLEDLNSLFD
jgi:hypothetical protein